MANHIVKIICQTHFCKFHLAPPVPRAAGICCNGSHGQGTTRWNPERGNNLEPARVLKWHNDDPKWMISHYSILFLHKIYCNPFQKNPHFSGYGFPFMGKLKKSSRFEGQILMGIANPILRKHSRSSNGPLTQGWFTMLDPPIKRDETCGWWWRDWTGHGLMTLTCHCNR